MHAQRTQMVTRLSGTPSFAKSRLKKLIKAASGDLFFARQRVTTEGKAMEDEIEEFDEHPQDDMSQYQDYPYEYDY
ncbi:hypothetical protein U0X70_16400 [Enterobacter hormaechei]|uniref:hypothetical protein n=1 Tax=Enterobacter hormaechei TaxID=158836 RepID=UPI0039C26A38